MTLLAPAYLYAALAVSAGVVALHFLVTRQPRAVALPTTRFVPEAPVTAAVRRLELSDLLLLVTRVLLVLAVGVALARPVITPNRQSVVRVIAADVSGSVSRPADVRDSARALWRTGDVLLAFDTAARVVATPDSLPVTRADASGALSTALAAALRAGSSVRAGADSVELVLVSPIQLAEADRATATLRALWPGRARLVHVAARADSVRQTRIVWPDANVAPPRAVARPHIDTAGAVMAGGAVAVALFERRWMYPSDSLRGTRVIARWADGDVAAIERDSVGTCVRSTVIRVDSAGDMTLRPDISRVRDALGAPCGVNRETGAMPDDAGLGRMLAGRGALARTAAFPPMEDLPSPLTRWLLLVALLLAVIELALRAMRFTSARHTRGATA